MSIANSIVRSFNDKCSICPMSLIWLSTLSTLQVVLYLGFGGFMLNAPFMNWTTKGCWLTLCPWISGWYADNVDLYTLRVEYSIPFSIISARKLVIFATEASNGLIITPASTKLKGGYTGFTLSVRLSVSPSVDRIVSALYLKQYLSDPFYISTSYQATSEGVSLIMFQNSWIFKNFGKFF